METLLLRNAGVPVTMDADFCSFAPAKKPNLRKQGEENE